MNIIESISFAINSIKAYKLRAALTLLSISIGVFAIMGSGTLVDSINNAVTDELSELGENSFIIKRLPSIRMGNVWGKYRKRKPITYSQLNKVRQEMKLTDMISGKTETMGQKIKAGNLTTDNDVALIGTDENYFNIMNLGVESGRPLSLEDRVLNRNVAVIGNDVVVKIFPNVSPIGKKIYIKNQAFTVIGVLEIKGAVLGQSQDNYVVIPLNQFLKYYTDWWNESITITIKARSRQLRSATIDEAIGILRNIRNVQPWEENSFEVETNESISEQFSIFTFFLSIFGFFCGFIALTAAGVGIMNIMLVSVKERTREIGVRKAVGAKRRWILNQFIIETITLCQIGGLFGIGFGIFGAIILGKMLNINIVFSLFWFVSSIIICLVLGLIFGAYPAWKAAKLSPIEALRYE